MPILAFERRERKEDKVPDQRLEERKRKFPIKDWKKSKRKKKKERKSPIKDRKKTKEICKKVLGPNKYLNSTELSPPNKDKKETTT